MATKYRVTVKDGDSTYELNKHGNYEFQTIDYVDDFDDLPAALLAFLEWATDPDLSDKVALIVRPAKKAKKDKK